MAGTYNVIVDAAAPATTLKIGFGSPAQNDQIVKDAVAAVKALGLTGGKLVKLNGPASLPVAVAIGHEVAHLFGAVAVFDPKLGNKYVVVVSHDPDFAVGSVIE
ncbi:MAG: CRISPR-associated protein Csx3 [bacterium]|nr:CRISPR-associated protein Csx3 [bacterium]